MSSVYYNNLIKKVMDASYGNTWEAAVKEWKIIDCEEDEELSSDCICGKENLKYLFTIQNVITGKILYPIGSSCIKKFDRTDLYEETKIKESMYKLCHAIEREEHIELSTKYFTRKLLYALYQAGAFKANSYNHYHPEIDYNFLLDMFNKRDKNNITYAQQRKINGVIAYSIKPYLDSILRYK